MKKILLSFVVVTVMAVTGFGQDVVIVEPDAGLNIGALNDAIDKDTSSVIYELRRDGTYYIDGKISTDWPLHIRAEEGSGEKPKLIPAIDNEGESDRLFGLGGNTTLEGLYLTGLDELGNLNKNVIRVEVDDVRLVVSDCMIDYDRQAPIRLNAEGVSVFVNSCIIRNLIELNEPGDSKLVDTRGNQQDSVVFDNNTIFHTGDQFIRTDDGFLKYLRIDHNTILLMGDGVKMNYTQEVEITNNIFYNINWQGSDTTGGSSEESFLRLDSIGSDFEGFTDADRKFTITNNNIYLEQKYVDAMDNVTGTPRYHKARFMDEDCEAFVKAEQMDTSNTISEFIEFDNPPDAPMDFIALFHQNFGNLEGIDLGSTTFYADKDAFNPGGENDFTFNYSNSLKSGTAATDGGRLGSTMWSGLTSINVINKEDGAILLYPNPVNESVNISLSGLKSSSVKISFYNITGNVVKMVNIDGVVNATSVKVNMSDLSVGMYIYSYELENGSIGSGKISVTR